MSGSLRFFDYLVGSLFTPLKGIYQAISKPELHCKVTNLLFLSLSLFHCTPASWTLSWLVSTMSSIYTGQKLAKKNNQQTRGIQSPCIMVMEPKYLPFRFGDWGGVTPIILWRSVSWSDPWKDLLYFPHFFPVILWLHMCDGTNRSGFTSLFSTPHGTNGISWVGALPPFPSNSHQSPTRIITFLVGDPDLNFHFATKKLGNIWNIYLDDMVDFLMVNVGK